MEQSMIRKTFFCVVVLICGFGGSAAFAQSDYEREQVRLMLIQLSIMEQIAKQMERNTTVLDTDRYRFDHARLNTDLKAMRLGLEHYLSPSRAQPRDVVEMVGDYRTERRVNHGDE
jgi:RAQPRD family integrative conjugative element protein